MTSFQDRSAAWMGVAFKDDPTDAAERRDRTAEEDCEGYQAAGGTLEDWIAIGRYTFGRPAGTLPKEIGQKVFTLACWAAYHGIDMMAEAERELARCSTPEFIEKLARKRATRHGRGPLPGFSGPETSDPGVASGPSPTPDGVIKERGEDDADLNARLKAAGMYSIPEMMGVTPLTRWTVQAGMTSLDAFAAWLDRRVGEFLRMKAGYELGDKDKGDELYEWVNAHSAALSEARENFRAAREAMAEAPASTVQPPSSQVGGVGEADFATLVQIDVGAMAIGDQAASKISDERSGYQDGFHQGAISAAGRIRSLIRVLMPEFDSRVAGLSAPRPSQREG